MMIYCAVCDQELRASDAASRIENEEDHYFFCSDHCRELFEDEPGLYVAEQDDEMLERRES